MKQAQSSQIQLEMLQESNREAMQDMTLMREEHQKYKKRVEDGEKSMVSVCACCSVYVRCSVYKRVCVMGVGVLVHICADALSVLTCFHSLGERIRIHL
jgi:hypothetical protein